MPPSTPFVDRDTGEIDTVQILTEARPLAKLVGVVAAVALVPYVLAFAIGSHRVLGVIFSLVGQFVLAVGGGLVLMYVVTRALQLADV